MKCVLGNELSNTSRTRFDRLFSAIKQESSEARSLRWLSCFDRSTALSGQPVLFGAGPLGKLVLDRLRRAGVEPCCFSDNNSAYWGTQVNGVEVLSPVDAVTRFGKLSNFIVSIYNGSTVRTQLREMGCTHVLPVATLFWKYPRQFMPDLGIDSPEIIIEQETQIRDCFELLFDEASRHEFCDQFQWRYWLEPEFLPRPQDAGELYFPDGLILPYDEEAFVDCGAFDGDSIRSFLRRGRSFSHVYALEPDARNRSALLASVAQHPSDLSERVTVWPYAVSDQDGTLSFVATSDVASKVSSSGDWINLECRKLDSLAWPVAPTYIKMDVEGCEPQALAGAAHLLQKKTPVLAICLYHRAEHLWQIPNLIHSIEPSYSLFLRRYAEDCWEQVCYAVPAHRLAHKLE